MLLVGVWLWRTLSKKDRVVTFTRGRVEVSEGAWTQSWRIRDFRFVEQAYSLHQTKHLTLHTVRLWLVKDGDERVELLRYEQESFWTQTDADRYAQVDRALARLDLRERLPAPALVNAQGTSVKDSAPPRVDETGDVPPRFGVEQDALEPPLRDVLVGAARLPPGVRMLPDWTEGEASLAILGLVVGLLFALPVVGGVVAATIQNPESWKIPRDGPNSFAMLALYAVVGGLAYAPIYFGRQIPRRRRVDASIRAGLYAQGIYLLPDGLLLFRAGRVTVMPRARIHHLARVRGGGMVLGYRSAENLREAMLLEGRYLYHLEQGDPFKVLEDWWMAGRAAAPEEEQRAMP
ncbi:hypothetical protein JY651_45210 [Pyxidicoccus parkwayensis]|uniref:Uncharacterized protein n=1 Tax=Pyxidicoccus parkwayensis TaxID=2813578 RepID=A0ABX7NV76_9BACT|nr:hypothetical protein [Pyxidicoccus parkwaysis]QSQ22254.1 hypothetical protein JY651_45210 [Pyxidicoccus parkwaysis]